MFLFNCATLGYVSLYFIFSKRSEIFMKRLKQIGALLSIAVLIGFGLGAMIFAFIDTPFAHKALTVCLYCAITVPAVSYTHLDVYKRQGKDRQAGEQFNLPCNGRIARILTDPGGKLPHIRDPKHFQQCIQIR